MTKYNDIIGTKLRKWDGVYTGKQQASFLGVDPKTVNRWRSELGITKPKPVAVKITPELDDKIRAMFAEGMSRIGVSQATGVGVDRLARHYPGCKMDPQEAAKLGGFAKNAYQRIK